MRTKFCVKKKTLLLIAGIVWMIAGVNVARLGVISYLNAESDLGRLAYSRRYL